MSEDRWQDRLEIAALLTGWIYRDLVDWDKLRDLFHPDGTIAVTWFEGLASEFVNRSMEMGRSDLRSKHFIASPLVNFSGARAIVETNAMIVCDNAKLNLGATAHNRFYDQVEKRKGVWKIVSRQSIYDFGHFNFYDGVVAIDNKVLEIYPREYASLAYLLEKSGFPLKRLFATKGSYLEESMKANGQAWLRG